MAMGRIYSNVNYFAPPSHQWENLQFLRCSLTTHVASHKSTFTRADSRWLKHILSDVMVQSKLATPAVG